VVYPETGDELAARVDEQIRHEAQSRDWSSAAPTGIPWHSKGPRQAKMCGYTVSTSCGHLEVEDEAAMQVTDREPRNERALAKSWNAPGEAFHWAKGDLALPRCPIS